MFGVSMAYCMNCQKLIEAGQATDIMKTGFYKVNIPVALSCVNCQVEEKNEAPTTEEKPC
jgi:hypothetical protein